MTVNLGFGAFEINADDFTTIEGNGSVYRIIAAASTEEAFTIRRERMPGTIAGRFVYWEARTPGNDIAGRDSLGDYEDITSEPDILEEIRRNNPEGVKKWLGYGININRLMGRFPNVFSPLILACQYGNFEIIKLLLENGADVNFAGNPVYKTAPLLESCRRGNAEICACLLDRGADIHYRDAGGWDARQFAEHFSHPEILQILDSKAPAEIKNELDTIKRQDNLWICGRCANSNDLNLDFCAQCGKEFNPPL